MAIILHQAAVWTKDILNNFVTVTLSYYFPNKLKYKFSLISEQRA